MAERFEVEQREEWAFSWEGNDPNQWLTGPAQVGKRELEQEVGKPVHVVHRTVYVWTGEWKPGPEAKSAPEAKTYDGYSWP